MSERAAEAEHSGATPTVEAEMSVELDRATLDALAGDEFDLETHVAAALRFWRGMDAANRRELIRQQREVYDGGEP